MSGDEMDDYPFALPMLPSTFSPEEKNDSLLGSLGSMGLENFENETEDGNGTMSMNEFSTLFQVSIYILYNTVFIAAVLGNVLVCYVVFSSPRMRTVTNYLIANLALGDLLMAVLCVPFSYIPVLYQYWPFGTILCHVLSPAQAVCVFVSAYTLVALAGDRYMAILYPLKPRLRRSQAVIVIFVVWAIAIITAIPIAVYTKLDIEQGKPECQERWGDDEVGKLYYSLALMILQYFFPLAVLVFTYTRIALAVWGKKAPGEAEDGRDQRLAKAKRKMIKMMLTVVIVYTMSWLPFNTIIVFADLRGVEFWQWEPIRYIYILCHWMAMSHTVCNPIIYCWMNSRFRVGFRSAVSRLPLLKTLLNRRNTTDYDYRLQRIGTCTTYTFTPNSHNNTSMSQHKLNRGSSLISNKTSFSESPYQLNNATPTLPMSMNTISALDRSNKILLDRDRDRDRSLSPKSSNSIIRNVSPNGGNDEGGGGGGCGGCGCGPNCSLNGGLGNRSLSPRLNNNSNSNNSGVIQGHQGQGHSPIQGRHSPNLNVNSMFLSGGGGGGSGSSIGTCSTGRRGSSGRRDSISESFM